MGNDPLSPEFPRLAIALCGRRAEVLSAWERAVRQTVADADAFTVAQLLNSIPEVIDHICATLSESGPDATRHLIQQTREHGTVRFGQRFAVSDLLVEYQLLRQVVFEEVGGAVDGGFAAGEVVTLNLAVDAVLHGGMAAFVDAQRRHLERGADVESKFLAYLAHDQRNNMNHALLLLEVHSAELAKYPKLQASLADLTLVRESIAATTAGMERLMEAERLRRMAVRVHRRPVDLDELLRAVAAAHAGPAAAKSLAVQLVPAPGGATVQSDSDLIRLTLNNLVGNAIKYADRGAVRLAIRPWPDPAGGPDRGWQVTVSDDGPGIAVDRLGQLFDAFVRGETHGKGGMGLGLSIASQAARLIGGTLTVESAVGVGSTFTLSIPAGPTDLLLAR